MSFNVSFVVLLVLLCISLHACHARRLAVYNNRADDNLHVHNPNDDEKRVSIVASKVESQQSTTTTTTSEAINGGDQVVENKEKDLTAEKNKNGRKDSVDSVAWKVPHSKHEEKHPGFNLDYSPPKTHPPSHN